MNDSDLRINVVPFLFHTERSILATHDVISA